MLTLPFGTAFDITIPEFTFIGDANLQLRFTTLCTSFEHDAGATTFSGTAALAGVFLYAELYTSGTLSSTVTESMDEPVILTVASATFDTAASTGSAHLTFTNTGFQLDEWSVSTIIAGLDLEDLSLVGTTGVVGTIGGVATLLPVNDTVTLDSREFSLAVGAVCF